MRFRVMAAAAVVALLAAALGAQKTADGDWPMYGRDLAGTKFSPLKQVTAENVLEAAARLEPDPRGEARAGSPDRGAGRGAGGPEILSNPEVTPIVVNGVMYLLAAGNQIMALDAATGKEIWRYHDPGRRLDRPRLAYWPGDRNNPERMMFTASAPKGKPGGARLVALDAATGKPSEGFGANGIADIGVPWNGVPLVFKNVIALGATVGEVPDGPPGDTRAFDARTGKKLWEFHTVPRPGELGHETWPNDGWKSRSGVNVWGWYMTVDERARHPLYADRRAGRELLGRRSSRQQPVRELDGGGRCRDRQVQVALPDRASRSVGLGHAVAADARGHQAERPDDPGARLDRQDRLHVHPRSRDRQADLRRRGAARAEGRRPRRVVFADAAVSREAAAAHARRVQEGTTW